MSDKLKDNVRDNVRDKPRDKSRDKMIDNVRDKTIDKPIDMAVEYFCNGMYCSQAVLGAFCEKYGLDKETACRISLGLNSGVRSAEVCGAVTGAILVVGLKYGDSKDIANDKTEEYIRRFIEKNKSIVCRDLLGCDIATSDGRNKAIEEDLFNTKCLELVTDAAQLLIDLDY